MAEAKYSVSQQPVQTLLSWIDSGQVAIPEMQRPFVWNSTKVRDLLDSLYQGFPVGYLITWQSSDVAVKVAVCRLITSCSSMASSASPRSRQRSRASRS